MKKQILLAICLAGINAHAAAFISPNGITEECRILPRIPGGDYSKGDAKDEQEFCGYDFYSQNSVALCPKTWSTSPGTMIYDISGLNVSQREYEADPKCGGTKEGHKKLARFKATMNQTGTSGTYSPSALLYYHLSRFLDTTVEVPVAVYRSIDKNAHFSRVTKKAHTGSMGRSAMNKAGWKWLYQAEQNPAIYKPTSDLFTSDQNQIYGTILGGGGMRYGEEINGIRSKWGDAQNLDFQKTPAFLALRSELPLAEAIKSGLAQGMKDAKIARAMGGGASNLQMALWMRELSEITIMDYIMAQQDRVGNIDFKWSLVNQDGEVEKLRKEKKPRAAMKAIMIPAGAQLIQRTQLVDNDAGGRPYVNYTKRTKMLEGIRHMSGKTYSRLQNLANDLRSKGELYNYLQSNFKLSTNSFKMIVANAMEAAAILKNTCKAGKLRFDLHGLKGIIKGEQEEPAQCEGSGV